MVKGGLVKIKYVTSMMSFGLHNLGHIDPKDYPEATGVMVEHKGQIGIIIENGTTKGFENELVEWFLVYMQNSMEYVFADKCELELL